MKSLSPIKRHVHFIGIGGIGMSALALILIKKGFSVSGSDHIPSQHLIKLKEEGVKIFISQSSKNVEKLSKYNKKLKPLIIISSAILENNEELIAANKLNIDIWHRSDLLASLIKEQESIAVAGSHGKTTTSTIIATLLALTGQDPTAIIGGIIPYFNSNANAGKGRILVAEADESDGSLIKFEAEVGLITNIELDHTDYYSNIDDLIKTMKCFRDNCKKFIANYDCKILRKNFEADYWWSVQDKENADFAALPIKNDESGQMIADFYEKNKFISQITLPIPGLHNLSNTVGAIAACRIQGIPFQSLKKEIPLLKMPGRRFEYKGVWEGRHVVDDYAHHPSEVEATVSMTRKMINNRDPVFGNKPERLIVVFQPHRYSRTNIFEEGFANGLSQADLIILAPIYGAGEKPIKDVSSEALGHRIQKNHPSVPLLCGKSLDQVAILVKNNTQENDLILTMGAGNISNIWGKLNLLSENKKCQNSSISM